MQSGISCSGREIVDSSSTYLDEEEKQKTRRKAAALRHRCSNAIQLPTLPMLAPQTLITESPNPSLSPASPPSQPSQFRTSSDSHRPPSPPDLQTPKTLCTGQVHTHASFNHLAKIMKIPKTPTHDPASRSSHSQPTPHNPPQSCTISGIEIRRRKT
jgi:hypothetical protein